MEEYSYTEGSSMSDSDDSNKYDAFSFGPILEPEVSYVFHAARRFALQIGVGVYVATMAATVEGKGAHYELPAPIINGFLGFRL
jgi:hypothetical protein